MVLYNFKKIQAVPTGKDFVDIALTRTQRRTPTVVHPGYAISRIRKFYMRKVKYTQQTIHDKLTQILTDFPVLDVLHSFTLVLNFFEWEIWDLCVISHLSCESDFDFVSLSDVLISIPRACPRPKFPSLPIV